MLPKTFTLKTPVDSFAVPLEFFLTAVASNILQSSSGTYIGTGKTQTITTPFYPKLIIISPFISLGTAPVTTTSNMVISLATNIGASWIPGTGFVKDCVTSASKTNFIIGVNPAVNKANSSFTYFVIG